MNRISIEKHNWYIFDKLFSYK